ncbi:NADPH-dependent FMN reductase [Comamonas humi]
MAQYHIAVIVGSLRKDSFNRQLANAVIKLAPQDFSLQIVPINELPLYNQDQDSAVPDVVNRFKDTIKQSQGVLFVTPEHNRSLPAAMKNALDQGSRPWGQSVWAGKPAGVMGISPGAAGTSMAQQHLRNVLAFLDVPTMGQPEMFLQMREGMFNADGSIAEASREFLQKWMDKYTAWVRKQAA